ncbi:hypothetical protein [Ligilactobacillus salivarius]|uniref:hypothetical protein n=1 Tax=Ligilactobacillus salivarius TaxID=1624 RepID=UPI0029660A4B|nr:hypothetical protein [Ligilactobacillus salivarius]MDW3022148.1 hypothetical protein [Ligilactobacillus salivarius]
MRNKNFTDLYLLNQNKKIMADLKQEVSAENADVLIKYTFTHILNRNFSAEFRNIIQYLEIDNERELGNNFDKIKNELLILIIFAKNGLSTSELETQIANINKCGHDVISKMSNFMIKNKNIIDEEEYLHLERSLECINYILDVFIEIFKCEIKYLKRKGGSHSFSSLKKTLINGVNNC